MAKVQANHSRTKIDRKLTINNNTMSLNRFTVLTITAVMLAVMSLISCNHPKYVSDYDYRKAEEAYQNNDYDEAMSLVEKQLKATPKNVDALYLRALIYVEANEYAEARADIDRAGDGALTPIRAEGPDLSGGGPLSGCGQGFHEGCKARPKG